MTILASNVTAWSVEMLAVGARSLALRRIWSSSSDKWIVS